MVKRILTAFIIILSGIGLRAATPTDSVEIMRPVFSAYTIHAGSAHVADTYLSPVRYSGWNVGFGYQRLQAMAFSPENWVMGLKTDLAIARTTNIAGNHQMWQADISGSWAMMRRWQLPKGFSAGAGPAIALDLGALYIAHNGNNPVSAKASLDLCASAYASWNGKLRSLPITVRYEAMLPALGVFFAPDYGELYYEIYLGNHSGLAHCGWWGNHFRYSHQLTADLRLGATSLRVGYAGEIASTKVNHLVSQTIIHSAIIGLSGEWMSINPRRPLSPEARIISATY